MCRFYINMCVSLKCLYWLSTSDVQLVFSVLLTVQVCIQNSNRLVKTSHRMMWSTFFVELLLQGCSIAIHFLYCMYFSRGRLYLRGILSLIEFVVLLY